MTAPKKKPRKRPTVLDRIDKTDPSVRDSAAVASIFLPDALTGKNAKKPPAPIVNRKGWKPPPEPVKPGQVASDRRALSLGVGDEDTKKWRSQPENASTTRLRIRTKKARADARAAVKAEEAERARKVKGRYPGAGVTEKTPEGQRSPLDYLEGAARATVGGVAATPGSILQAPSAVKAAGSWLKGGFENATDPDVLKAQAGTFPVAADWLGGTVRDVTQGAQKYGNALFNVGFGVGGATEKDKLDARKAAGAIVGEDAVRAFAGGEYNPGLAVLEGATMFLPVKGLPSIASGALRAIIGGTRFARATREGLTVAEALKAAKFTEPVRPIARARRSFTVNDATAWEPAARAGSGRLVERGFDRFGRPVISKVGVGPIKVKNEAQKTAQVAQRRMKHDAKVDSLPGVQLRAAVGHYTGNLRFNYALRAMAIGIDPLEASAAHARMAVEMADDPQVRANHILHMEGWKRAAKWVKTDADGNLYVAADAPQRLTRAWEALPESAAARERLLGEMGLATDEQMEARLHLPGRVLKGAKYTPEQEHAMNEIRKSPQRAKVESELLKAGVDEKDVQTILEQHDAIARKYWETVRGIIKDPEQSAALLEKMDARIRFLSEAAQGDPAILRDLARAKAERETVARAIESGGDLPYDAYWRNLQEFGVGFPDDVRQSVQQGLPGVLFEARSPGDDPLIGGLHGAEDSRRVAGEDLQGNRGAGDDPHGSPTPHPEGNAETTGYASADISSFPAQNFDDLTPEQQKWWMDNAANFYEKSGVYGTPDDLRAWVDYNLQNVRRTATRFRAGPEAGISDLKTSRGIHEAQLRGENLSHLSGATVPGEANPNPLAAQISADPALSRVFVSEHAGSIPLTSLHELTHFWQQHFPGALESLERAFGGRVSESGYPVWQEDAAEAYVAWLRSGGAEQPVTAETRHMFQKTTALLWREGKALGGMFDELPIPPEAKDLFESLYHWGELEGGKIRGFEDFQGGKVYTLFEAGLPRDLRHPLRSQRAYVQTIRGLFGKTVGQGFVDPSVKKEFRGYLIRNGFYKADVVNATVASLAKAVKMHTIVKARRFLLEASTETPQSLQAIPIYVDPTKNTKARKELAHRLKIIESLSDNGDFAKHIDLEELKGDPMSWYEDLTRDSFPSHLTIDGEAVKAENVARQIREGVLGPIDNVRWVEPDLLYEGDLFSNPKAFFSRGESWGQLEALGVGIDVINDLMKMSVLQLNPAYMGMNLLGNAALVLMQQGPYAAINLPRALALSREVGPDLAVAIDHYMGRGVAQLAETRKVFSRPSGVLADLTGVVVDKIPRRMAFLHEAWRKNYRTADDLRFLLENKQAADDLAEITARANDAVIDYERLSPLERKIIARGIFIYPWIKGATRFTFRFPLEHPVQAMAMAYLYERQQAWADANLGERPWYSEYLAPAGNPFNSPEELIPFGPAPSRVPTVERYGQEYPNVWNPKQVVPFTTPVEFAEALAGYFIPGDQPWQSAVEVLQPFYPALIASLSGYDTFSQREVQSGIEQIGEQAMQFPLRDRIEAVGATPEEREERASNRLYPRNEADDWKKTVIGTLAPTPYNVEKGKFYAAGERGKTPEQEAREDYDELSSFTNPETLKEGLDARTAWKKKLLEAHKHTDDLTDVEQAKMMVDLAVERGKITAENGEQLKGVVTPSTAGEIRGAAEKILLMNEVTAARRRKSEYDKANATAAGLEEVPEDG